MRGLDEENSQRPVPADNLLTPLLGGEGFEEVRPMALADWREAAVDFDCLLSFCLAPCSTRELCCLCVFYMFLFENVFLQKPARNPAKRSRKCDEN